MKAPAHTKSPMLVARCNLGDASAYKELYERYSKAMFNISQRIVNSRHEAEDILQDAFSQAFQDMTRFANEPAFAGWLKRVVINNSIELIRKRKLSLVQITEIDLPDEESLEPEVDYDAELIQRCISMLPDGYRVVLTLYLFEDLSHKEIAGLLNISEGTSKSQYNRSRKKLVELITQNSSNHASID